MKFLPYEPRENRSIFTRVIIYMIPHYIENILALEMDFIAYYWFSQDSFAPFEYSSSGMSGLSSSA